MHEHRAAGLDSGGSLRQGWPGDVNLDRRNLHRAQLFLFPKVISKYGLLVEWPAASVSLQCLIRLEFFLFFDEPCSGSCSFGKFTGQVPFNTTVHVRSVILSFDAVNSAETAVPLLFISTAFVHFRGSPTRSFFCVLRQMRFMTTHRAFSTVVTPRKAALPRMALSQTAPFSSGGLLQRSCLVTTRKGPLQFSNGPVTPRTCALGHLVADSLAVPYTGGLGFRGTPLFDLSEGLETPVQLIYLSALLGFLVIGAYLVVRQVLIRRELEEAAKVLGDRVRAGEASSEDYFELGVILLRKKLFTQATKNLEKARKEWEGEAEELAQVHNALGYAYFNMDRVDAAVAEYKAAVTLQPGYVTAWNNLGDAYEKLKSYGPAFDAYSEALSYAPDNTVAKARAQYCKTRIDRSGGISA